MICVMCKRRHISIFVRITILTYHLSFAYDFISIVNSRSGILQSMELLSALPYSLDVLEKKEDTFRCPLYCFMKTQSIFNAIVCTK